MAFNLATQSLYVKGTADIWVYDISSGDVVGYSSKLDTSQVTSSANNGEIRAGLGAPVQINLPDSATFTGTITAQDFSLEARKFQTGGNLNYNGTIYYSESITATTTTLTVSNTPVAAYGEPSSDTYYNCYVGTDGVNYGVNPSTKEVQNFTAVVGQTYCVRYCMEAASARELTIPTVFSPSINRVVIRMAVYAAQGTVSQQSSFAGWLYIHIPRAQFIDGDAGVNGNQTENATTEWTFSALSYTESDVTCSECAMDNSVLGYMVYAPCGSATVSVQSLVVVGGEISVAVDGSLQIPVRYVMPDSSVILPTFTDMTYTSEATGTATVSTAGVVTGVAAGETQINIALTSDPTIKTVAVVTVTA